MTSQRIATSAVGLCVWLLGVSLHAELLIEDTFTGYPDNAVLSAPLDEPDLVGLGLAGDWTISPENDDFFVNKTRDDDNAGTGKAVYERPPTDNGTRKATRNTASGGVELYGNDGDVFYASFLIDPADARLANGRLTFELRLEQLSGGGVSDFSFGMVDGQYAVIKGDVAASDSNSFVKVAGGNVADGSEQLILARIQYGDGGSGNSGADDNETVTLWVNPVDESSEPLIDKDPSVDFLNRGGGMLTSISMRGQNMYGDPAFFDNLRVGTTFASVVPEPATGILLALGFFALFPFVLRRR